MSAPPAKADIGRRAATPAGRALLSDGFQALRILLETPDINVGAAGDHFDCLLVERADGTRRRADDQRFVGKGLAFGDECAGADERILADARTVEQDRAHADE